MHKPLPETFRRDGFEYRQVRRAGRVILLEQVRGGVTAYEVVKTRILPTFALKGRIVEAHEAMPPPGDWGASGWTFATGEAARGKFEALAVACPGSSVARPEIAVGEADFPSQGTEPVS